MVAFDFTLRGLERVARNNVFNNANKIASFGSESNQRPMVYMSTYMEMIMPEVMVMNMPKVNFIH